MDCLCFGGGIQRPSASTYEFHFDMKKKCSLIMSFFETRKVSANTKLLFLSTESDKIGLGFVLSKALNLSVCKCFPCASKQKSSISRKKKIPYRYFLFHSHRFKHISCAQ